MNGIVKKIVFKWLYTHLFLLLAGILTGCQPSALKEEDLDTGKAKVMVVYANPSIHYTADSLVETSGIYVRWDGNLPYTAPIYFPSYSPYAAFTPGKHQLKVTTDKAGTTKPLLDSSLNMKDNKAYMVFITDMLPSARALVLEEELQPPTQASQQASIRFVHFSPDMPTVDVLINRVNGNEQIEFETLSFRSSESCKDLKADTYYLELRKAGNQQVILSRQEIKIEAGKVYTVFARGFLHPPKDSRKNLIHPLGLSIITNYYTYP